MSGVTMLATEVLSHVDGTERTVWMATPAAAAMSGRQVVVTRRHPMPGAPSPVRSLDAAMLAERVGVGTYSSEAPPDERAVVAAPDALADTILAMLMVAWGLGAYDVAVTHTPPGHHSAGLSGVAYAVGPGEPRPMSEGAVASPTTQAHAMEHGELSAAVFPGYCACSDPATCHHALRRGWQAACATWYHGFSTHGYRHAGAPESLRHIASVVASEIEAGIRQVGPGRSHTWAIDLTTDDDRRAIAALEAARGRGK